MDRVFSFCTHTRGPTSTGICCSPNEDGGTEIPVLLRQIYINWIMEWRSAPNHRSIIVSWVSLQCSRAEKHLQVETVRIWILNHFSWLVIWRANESLWTFKNGLVWRKYFSRSSPSCWKKISPRRFYTLACLTWQLRLSSSDLRISSSSSPMSSQH